MIVPLITVVFCLFQCYATPWCNYFRVIQVSTARTGLTPSSSSTSSSSLSDLANKRPMARVRVGGIICSFTSCDSAGNTQCSRAMCLKHCLGASGDCTNPAHKRKKTSAVALTAPSSPAIADAHPSITATPLPIVNANTPSHPIPPSAIHGPSQPYPPQPYPPLPSPPLPSTSTSAVPSSTPPVPSTSTFPLPAVPRALPRDRTFRQ